MWCRLSTRTWPSRTAAVLAVVPPMSRARTCRAPSLRPSSAAAVTPATGPDSSRPIGARAAWPNEHTPPLERITCSGPRTPADRSAPSSEPR